jgi:MscS family membrane protein
MLELKQWFASLEQWLSSFNQEWSWVLQVFMIVLATVFVNFFAKRILAKGLQRLHRTDTQWDNILLEAMSRPLTWIVWLVGLSIASHVIYAETESSIFTATNLVRDVGILICFTWFLLNFIRAAERELSRDSDQIDKHTVVALGKLIRLAILITAGLIIMQELGFSIAGILAMGGIGGVAVGFASKDLLANFFGGLIIYLDKPFTEGDWIRSPDRGIEGTVEEIGWRITKIRNFESRPIYVPNSVFLNIIVENPSRMENRRINETIGLRYSDLESMDKIVAEVKAMLIAHQDIDSNRTLIINFIEFAGSSVDFLVYTFTKTTEWVKFHQVKQDVMLKISGIIEANGAEIAFPTSTLHISGPVQLENSRA